MFSGTTYILLYTILLIGLGQSHYCVWNVADACHSQPLSSEMVSNIVMIQAERLNECLRMNKFDYYLFGLTC